MTGLYFKLDDDKIAHSCTMQEWANQLLSMYKEDKKHVAHEKLNGKTISTVWLGINHSFIRDEAAIFETMVLEDDFQDIYCRRYSTWQEAEKGHKIAVQWVKDGCKHE